MAKGNPPSADDRSPFVIEIDDRGPTRLRSRLSPHVPWYCRSARQAGFLMILGGFLSAVLGIFLFVGMFSNLRMTVAEFVATAGVSIGLACGGFVSMFAGFLALVIVDIGLNMRRLSH